MNTGIYFNFGFDIDPDDRCAMIRKTGFDNVFFWWEQEYDNITAKRTTLTERARKHGLFVENAHLPYANSNHIWEDNIDGEELLQYYTRSVAASGQLDIPVLVLHLTNGSPLPAPSMIGVERLLRLDEAAQKSGVYIALENLVRPEYLDYVFERISPDNIKFCYDSGHEFCHSREAGLIEKYGGKIKALHLHDNNGNEDQHLIPGEGKIDWQSVMTRLKKQNYNGAISLELHHHPDYTDPVATLERAYEKARGFADLFE